MQLKLSLTTRAFLYAFVPVCLMLAAAFFTIHSVIRTKTKKGLQESMLRTERAMDQAEAAYKGNIARLLAAVGEDSGLKAAFGLLRESGYGQKPDARVLGMVRDQLRALAEVLDYDVLLLADADENLVTGFLGKSQEIAIASTAGALDLYPLLRLNGTLYEGTTVPVNLGSENLGSLIVGKKFEIGLPANSGFAALVHQGSILATNFPDTLARELGTELQARCPSGTGDCEIHLGGENYLAVKVENSGLGKSVQLFRLQSIDAATNDFTRGFQQAFLLIGAGGILIALLFSAFGSSSLSRPLTSLIGHLRESERTGRLKPDFSLHSPVIEVNQLGEAFNRAAEAIQESQGRLEQATLEFVETMAQALDARDPYTAGHSNRVSVNSTAIAEAMGLPQREVAVVRIGAILHDIGKIGVADAILRKPGKLTPEEYALIQLHPQIGKKILEKAGQFQDYLPIVELHHEDFDGGGYPYGLKGDQVPVGVRIVHVADVYDAISSHRAYRRAMSDEQVLRIMTEGSGTLFDPAVLGVFFTILREQKVLQEVLGQAGAMRA